MMEKMQMKKMFESNVGPFAEAKSRETSAQLRKKMEELEVRLRDSQRVQEELTQALREEQKKRAEAEQNTEKCLRRVHALEQILNIKFDFKTAQGDTKIIWITMPDVSDDSKIERLKGLLQSAFDENFVITFTDPSVTSLVVVNEAELQGHVDQLKAFFDEQLARHAAAIPANERDGAKRLFKEMMERITAAAGVERQG